MENGERKINRQAIEQIAREKNIRIIYKPIKSFIFTRNDIRYVFLDNRKTTEEQWGLFIKSISCITQ